jgi:hypothetical protein
LILKDNKFKKRGGEKMKRIVDMLYSLVMWYLVKIGAVKFAYNVPSYETERFSFGPGILYMGVPGTTPLVDVGAVKGDFELSFDLSKLEVKQGSPQTLVKTYTLEENIKLKGTLIEWDMNNLAYILGAGVTSASGANEILEFGGDMDTNNRALRFVHRTPDGGTIDMQIFKAEGVGKLALGLKETELHEFPFEFNVLEGTVDFSNAALANEKKKIKIIRTKA